MGVVYHANYFVWFELGRTELMRAAGFAYTRVEADGFRLPVHEVKCHYHRPAKYDDLVTVETVITHLSPARIDFAYRITRDGELLATGETVHPITDNQGRPINLKKKAPELWAALSAAVTIQPKES
ncbi:MAG: acyl-CoA thioesterase [Firmicutes bacterium]|nr:acyl-CoA thioesterase [Bacillota bacterium]